jgi:hypothetical protein
MFAGISHGNVYSYQNRVFTAILDLESVFQEQRIMIKTDLALVDGAPTNLYQKPCIDGEVYWNRKSRYAVNLH